MKQEITTVFGPSALPVGDVATAVTHQLTRRHEGLLSGYFAVVEFAPADNSYTFADETSDLVGEHDLTGRLARHGAGMWAMTVNAPFCASDVYVAVYTDDVGTHVVVSMDHYVTRIVEDEQVVRLSYLRFIVKLAERVGASWFVSGIIENWRPLALDDCRSRRAVQDRLAPDAWPYFCGWREGLLDTVGTARLWEADADGLTTGLTGFSVVSRLPLGPEKRTGFCKATGRIDDDHV